MDFSGKMVLGWNVTQEQVQILNTLPGRQCPELSSGAGRHSAVVGAFRSTKTSTKRLPGSHKRKESTRHREAGVIRRQRYSDHCL